jgi:tetratricopeptide (TPR) repeat protein
MRGWIQAVGMVALATAALTGGTGCIKKVLLDGQISSTRTASAAVNTIGDFEVANAAAFAGIAQMEGMRYLAPDNEDAQFLLLRSWAGASFGFIEDAMERAEDAGGQLSPEFGYHKRRAIEGYSRGIWYGKQLLEVEHAGFDAATRNADTIRAYVQQFDEDQVETLFWMGQAWMGRVGAGKDDPALVSELFVGVAFMERVLELKPTFLYGAAHVAVGSFHARSTVGELEEGKKHFEEALRISDGKFLSAKVQYARTYYCMKGDKENYTRLLQEVVDSGDTLPDQRLPNTLAKRKAARSLQPSRMANCGF